ncbi:uncharacterized protein LOC143287457 [Babylonia areolata]|uniref:uncharacterized protein LOC143287455 n=1 Tax=Babylonia areolata TaxID=304850 RepID=UPI003FD1E80D
MTNQAGKEWVRYVKLKLKVTAGIIRTWIPSWLTAVRGLSLCVFLCSTFSVSVSWASLVAFLVLIVSIYGVGDPNDQKPKRDIWTDPSFNPLKGKPLHASLSESREREVSLAISRFVTNYDPENCTSLELFETVKYGTECVFARRAKLWGSPDWRSALSLEENVFRCVPMFLKFSMVCQELGLDGFLFLLPGKEYGANLQVFGKAVRRVLQTVSDLDPAGFRCMDKSYLDKRGWVFEFNRITYFITTFAPFYPPSSSRYAHGAEDAFVLFQPEVSFAQHDLPPDSVKTNWDQPVTVRDRIRRAFRDAGREYKIRDTLFYPMVHEIVKPVREHEDPEVQWWLK